MKRPCKWVIWALIPVCAMFFPLFVSSPVQAALDPPLYTRKAVVQIPNYNAAACYDIAFVHQGKLYMSDDTNKAVDVIDGTDMSRIGAGMFQGIAGCHSFDFSQEGPTGVLVEHGLVWAGDGNSTVKVFDALTGRWLATIATGPASNSRADEMDYLPDRNEVVIANPDATPFPYLSYIDARTFKIVHRQIFQNATAGLEQPRYAHGLLYQAIPATVANPGGEIDVIDPHNYKIVARYATGNCGPSGLELIGHMAATGCANGASEVINFENGKITVIKGSGAADMVAADPARGHFFFACYGDATLYVTTASGRTLQAIPTDSDAHSVAVNTHTGELYAPVGTLGGVAEYTLSA